MTTLEGKELLDYMMKVSRHMAEIRSLSPLLSYLMDEVLQFVGAERGYVVLTRPDGGLDFKVRRDKDGRDLEAVEDAISHSILAEVLQTNQSLVVGDAMSDPRFGQAHSVMYLRLRSVMCVPLITQNKTIGAIFVENRSARGIFEDEDLPPLELFAYQAAVAVANAALNDDLEQANENLRQLDRLKSEFVILVSHEMQTPLTAVKAYAKLLNMVDMQNANANEKAAEIRQKLENAIERMNRTIQEIILVFRIASGQFTISPRLSAIELPIMQVVEELADVCRQRQLHLHVDDLSKLPSLPLDVPHIQELFANVIGNAVKYTPDGGSIQISGQVIGDAVEIQIMDTGIGIPVEEQSRIFDMFYVLGNLDHHSTGKHRFQAGGMGLGLPIAKGIVEAHKGIIRLESNGRDEHTLPGTTCSIYLPLQ